MGGLDLNLGPTAISEPSVFVVPAVLPESEFGV